MSELRDRVVARIVAAQNARDPAPLRTGDAVGDALALLREAAPSPEELIDLDSVAVVCWTFWLRHQGPGDPEARRNVAITSFTFGFLCPRVPEDAPLPPPLRQAFDPADRAHDARFAYVVSSAYGDAVGNDAELGEPERLVMLDRAFAWSAAAHRYLPEGHEGLTELTFHALGLNVTRFQLAADPDALAAAARHAEAVLGSPGPPGAEAASFALAAVVDAARLLGEPSLADVERLVAAAPDGALTAEVAEGLRVLRELHAVPVSWPGELDLRAGWMIADAGAGEHDAGRIACGVRRLRAALAGTPADHPARPVATAALGQALDAFARERGDQEAAREAAGLLASVVPDEADEELVAAFRELRELADGAPEGPQRLGRVLALFRERTGEPLDIDLETLDLVTVIDSETVSDERIDRYRAAVAGLAAGEPRRHAYVAVLAALTGMRAQALRGSGDRAARLSAEARSLTDEVAAGAPDRFLPLRLLRRGLFGVALPAAVVAVLDPDGTEYAELAKLVSVMSRFEDIRFDEPGSGVEAMRGLLADIGEDLAPVRAQLAALLGRTLSADAAAYGDPATLDEIVSLLRYARSRATGEVPEGLDRLLASALVPWSLLHGDAEAARETSALLAAATPEGADDLRGINTEFYSALMNYVFGHEPGQLERARGLARRIKELAAGGPPGLGVMGDAMLDLVETVGPGGGPKGDLTDEQIDRCRRTFAACPAGHPMRPFTALTLVRVLAQRANAIRGTDPERTARLLAEVDELIRTVEEEAAGGPAATHLFEGWADMVRGYAGIIERGELPPLAPRDRPPERPAEAPANAVEAIKASLLSRMSGAADPGAWRDPAIPVWVRAHGEIGAAGGAIARGRVDLALSHLEAAVEAMAGVTDRGSDQETAEHGLTSFEGDIRTVVELALMATHAREAQAELHDRMSALKEDLATALREGRPPDPPPALDALRTVAGPDVDRATELLERGRGLLLSRRMEARADLGDLRSAHPALAEEFERLTDRLAAEPDPPGPVPAGHAELTRLAKLRASRELDELLDRVRARPGFGGFLRPLSAEGLRSLAADGPIVVLNHAQHRCYALVVTAGSITALGLDVEAEEVADAARRLRDAVGAINTRGSSRPSPARLVAAADTVRETLAWTWHKIVGPVLDLAGSRDPVPGGDWPRVWWVATGAFNALPLHAAECARPGCELGGCGAALDAVVSSYAPGFQTLAYARGRAGHRVAADAGDALLVASPEDELPGVATAAGYAAGLLGAPGPLVGAAATRDAVLAALGAAPWVHFGCHAATDPDEPSGALLHLPSGEALSVLEICRARPRSARLAFLAACGTARTSERLTDEAIHITSAFLLAGFPAAVGTLWEIDSTHADHVTRGFYRRIAGGGGSAHALHHTVRELRRRLPGRPHVWAAYVHAGT